MTNDFASTREYLDSRELGYTVDADGFLHLTEWLHIPRGQSVTLDGIKSGDVDVWEGATFDGPSHTTGNVWVYDGATYNGPNHTTGDVWVWGDATYNGPNHTTGSVTVWRGATYTGPNHTAGDVTVYEDGTYNGPCRRMGHVRVYENGTYNGKKYSRLDAFLTIDNRICRALSAIRNAIINSLNK